MELVLREVFKIEQRESCADRYSHAAREWGSCMAIERDHDAERLARVEALLVEAKRTMATVGPKDPHLRATAVPPTDKMLSELQGQHQGARRRA